MLLYRNFAVVEECGDGVKIDLTGVDQRIPDDRKHPLYVSVRNDSGFCNCEGGKLSVYERHDGFTTYRIERTETGVVWLR